MDLQYDSFNFRSQLSGLAVTWRPKVVLLLVTFDCEFAGVGGDLSSCQRLSDSVDTDIVFLGCELAGAD